MFDGALVLLLLLLLLLLLYLLMLVIVGCPYSALSFVAHKMPSGVCLPRVSAVEMFQQEANVKRQT